MEKNDILKTQIQCNEFIKVFCDNISTTYKILAEKVGYKIESNGNEYIFRGVEKTKTTNFLCFEGINCNNFKIDLFNGEEKICDIIKIYNKIKNSTIKE